MIVNSFLMNIAYKALPRYAGAEIRKTFMFFISEGGEPPKDKPNGV